jgi:vitamin B12 transporter
MPKVRPFHGKVKAIITLSACLSTPAWADDLVVTANRVETEAAQLGSTVTVITAEEIERKQATTVAQLLRDVPGLSVSNTGGAGRATAVRIRGAESYHTKVIVDGVDLSDPSSSQPQYDFGHLLTSDIERVEVVRGPQSLLYGGEAMGGVINIITKRGSGAPKITALAEVGSNHSYTGSVGLRGSQDRVSYAMTATHLQTDGISAAEKRNGNGENDPYWNQTLTGRLGVRLTDTWSVDFNGRLMRSQVDYDSWSGSAAADSDDQMDKTERSGRLATEFTILNGHLTNQFAYAVSETERDIGVGKRQTSFFDGETQSWEYQGTGRISENHTVVFGAEAKTEETTQDSIIRDVSTNSAYADYQFSPIDSLYLTVGSRLDDHEAYGTHTTWRSTAAYLIDATQTRLHGSYGTGFRAPSLYELYHPTWGTPSLRPEESRGWDVGVEQTFLDGAASVDVTWFDNRLKDLIQWSMAGYTNIASTRAQGVEVSGQWALSEAWQVDGSYTFTNSRNNATGIVLARRPKHQGQASVSWRLRNDLSTTATVHAVGNQYDSATGNTVGGYGTVDLSAAYDVTEDVQLFGRVENIADKQYQEVDTYGTPGRTAYLGVRAAF